MESSIDETNDELPHLFDAIVVGMDKRSNNIIIYRIMVRYLFGFGGKATEEVGC